MKLLAGVVLGAIAALVAVLVVANSGPQVVAVFEDSCAIALAGTDLTVAAEGVGAGDWCASFAGTVDPTTGGRWVGAAIPGGIPDCQEPTSGGTMLSVYDRSMFEADGNRLCADLRVGE